MNPFCLDAGTMATNWDDLNRYDAVHNSFKKKQLISVCSAGKQRARDQSTQKSARRLGVIDWSPGLSPESNLYLPFFAMFGLGASSLC